MGLDMYLTKRTYVKNWDFETKDHPENKWSVLVKRGGKPYADINPKKISEVVEDVGYWRKANAIHQWFVDNVQDGEDDCREAYLEQDKLQELLDAVNEVLAHSELVEGQVQNGTRYKNGEATPIMEPGKYIKDPSAAERLLPTASGFFFGSTNYDQYYYQDLVDTKAILEEALKSDGGDFYYHSSW